MKKLLLAVCTVMLMASCCSVPQEVKDAFAAEFPTATDAVWECDDDGYDVSYVVDGVRYETEYDKAGNKKATDDPQPSSCSHGHATCSHGHNHAGCTGEHNHATCADSTSCTHDHVHKSCSDSTSCTHGEAQKTCSGEHNHANCSHGK